MSFIERITEKNGIEFAKDLIEKFMKKQKMNSVDELIKICPELKDFNSKTKLDNYVNIIKLHGLPNFNNETYKKIIDMIKEEEISKKQLNTDNINKTNVNGHEMITVTDSKTNETVLYDNTLSNRSIEDEMKKVQEEHAQFQNTEDNNTLGVMNYMKDNIKITPNLEESTNIDTTNENDEEKLIMEADKEFENQIGHNVKVDFKTKMIYDNGIVYSIKKDNDNYKVIDKNTNAKSEHTKSLQLVKKSNS